MVMWAVLGICGGLQGETISPVGANDARGCKDWLSGSGSYWWVDSESSVTMDAYWDTLDYNYKFWYVPVLEFPIASLAGRTNLDATLSVYLEGVNGGVQIRYGTDNNGVVETGDWLNYGVILATVPGGTTGWVQCDVSSQLQSFVDQGASWAVFTVRSSDQYYGGTVRASEYAGFSPRIDVVPEPSTVVLLAAGAVAAILRRRRT